MLILASAVCLGHPSTAQPADNANLDDRDVIRTALLALADDKDWVFDWRPNLQAILGTQYESPKRRSFSELLNREIRQVHEDVYSREHVMNHPLLGLRELNMLLALRSRGNGGAYVCPPVLPLTSYLWNKRIVLALPSAYLPGAKPKLRKEEGFLTVYLPSYSPDGEACILDIDRPWGERMHEADTLLLRRLKGRWVVAYISIDRPM
jgi:hypothetical protein